MAPASATCNLFLFTTLEKKTSQGKSNARQVLSATLWELHWVADPTTPSDSLMILLPFAKIFCKKSHRSGSGADVSYQALLAGFAAFGSRQPDPARQRDSCLFDDLCDHAGADRPAAFANRETQPFVHGDRGDQLNG